MATLLHVTQSHSIQSFLMDACTLQPDADTNGERERAIAYLHANMFRQTPPLFLLTANFEFVASFSHTVCDCIDNAIS